MKIGFRTDASIQIGIGHVMRCLTLADALREGGAQSLFFCRQHEGNLIDLIKQRGHEVITLPKLQSDDVLFLEEPIHAAWLGTDWSTDANATRQALGQMYLDWMVVDHYALDQHWERNLRPHCKRMMVIDDLADRQHDCDVLLDQNLGRQIDDYRDLVPESAALLIGPQFALLRPEFARLRPESLARRTHPTLKRLLITMGGVDKDNMTGQVLTALQASQLPPDMKITVVMGAHAPWLNNVREQSAQMPWPTKVLVGVSNIAELMVKSDLAIGAAGSTSWERCCLGLPTIQMVLAENQQSIADALSRSGASRTAVVTNLPAVLGEVGLTTLSQFLKATSDIAAQHVTGHGACEVAEHLISLCHENHNTLH